MLVAKVPKNKRVSSLHLKTLMLINGNLLDFKAARKEFFDIIREARNIYENPTADRERNPFDPVKRHAVILAFFMFVSTELKDAVTVVKSAKDLDTDVLWRIRRALEAI